MTFQEILNSTKEMLKANLTPENTTLLTQIDVELDRLHESHKELEKEHSDIKGKLIDVVKNTSFKMEKAPEEPNPEPEKIPTIDEAFSEAISEIENARK